MSDNIQLEAELFHKDNLFITINSLRRVEEDENKIRDKFNQYKKIAQLFGKDVFEIDEDLNSIQLVDDFQAREEHKLCLICQESKKSIKVINKARTKISALFEEMVAEAVKNYLGEGAHAKLVDSKTSNIDIKYFCENELKEKPIVDAQNEFQNTDNTPRCDIIVWKPLDERPGKIVCLVECKSGKFWRDEFPVNIRFWERIIQFSGTPLTMFAITDLMDKDEIWKRGLEKGLILDRARIIRLLATLQNEKINKVRKKIQDLKLEVSF